MRLKFVGGFIGALVCTGLLMSDAMAQRRDRDGDRRGGDQWVQLGCQQVSFRGRDRDAIRVGRREGRLKVVYGNGNPDDIDVRRVIRSGDRTQALDLKGRDRSIDRIEMVYRQRPDFSGRATICAEGLVA
jgi:hypothetical protein